MKKLGILAMACMAVLITFVGDANAATSKRGFDEIKKEAIALLDAGKLGTLDDKLTHYDRTRETKKEDGYLVIKPLFVAIAERIHMPLSQEEPRLSKWQKLRPNSYFPSLIRAYRLYQAAYEARGSGYSSSISPDSKRRMQNLADEAIRTLDAIKFPNNVKSPVYYKWKLSASVVSSNPNKKEELISIFQEASRQTPLDFGIYLTMMYYLQPKWFGEPGEVTAFINDQADRVKGPLGDELYARLAAELIDLESTSNVITWNRIEAYGFFYKHPEIQWERMNKGFQNLIRNYPSTWSLNNYAFFACIAGDKETARSLLERVKQEPDIDLWGGPSGYLAWAAWAAQPDLPVAEQEKKQWDVRKVQQDVVRFGGKSYKYGFNEVKTIAYDIDGSHFEGAGMENPDHSISLMGMGYQQWPGQEIRGYFLGSAWAVRKIGQPPVLSNPARDLAYKPLWRRDNIGKESETLYMGHFYSKLKHLNDKGNSDLFEDEWAGVDFRMDGSAYFGLHQRSHRTGLGRLISSSGFKGLKEIYYGDLKDGLYDGFGLLAGSELFQGYTFAGMFKGGKPVGTGVLINLPVWRLYNMNNDNIRFVECKADGSFKFTESGSAEVSAHPYYDTTNNGYDAFLIDHNNKDGSPTGTGIRFIPRKMSFIVTSRTEEGEIVTIIRHYRSETFSNGQTGEMVRYDPNKAEGEQPLTLINGVLYRGYFVSGGIQLDPHTRWNGYNFFGQVIYPDGHMIDAKWLYDDMRQLAERAVAAKH